MKKKFLKLTAGFALMAVSFSSSVFADDSQLLDLVKNMESQMKQMQKTIENQNSKIQRLENRPAGSSAVETSSAAPVAAPMSDYEFNQRLDAATGGAQKWLKDLKFSGDLRLRYEAFKYSAGSNETDDRNRFRYRLRYGFEKKFNEEVNVGFAMASGEGPTLTSATAGAASVQADPTSTNTTFDNNFNFKDVYIEKAWASYAPSYLANIGPLDRTTIVGGKMNNLFERGSSDMIWDRDVKPEGLQEQMDFSFIKGDNFDLNGFATFGQFVLDEDSTVDGDSNLFAYQVGLNPIVYTPFFERPVDVLQTFSYYDYQGYARKNNFVIGGNSLARGNPNADGITTELDAGDFNVLESYTEVAVYPFNLPTRFFADAAVNTAENALGFASNGNILGNAVTDENNAYAFGIKLGSIVQKGDWEAAWAFKHIGANAVVGAFNDSDFGDGHAGKHGNQFKLGYALTDTIFLNGSAFFVENLNSGTAGIVDQQQRRFQVDLVWKF